MLTRPDRVLPITEDTPTPAPETLRELTPSEMRLVLGGWDHDHHGHHHGHHHHHHHH